MSLSAVKHYWKYLATLLWMGVIFYLSSEPAGESSRRSGVILENIQSLNSDLSYGITMFAVRKAAHFIAYMILGILLYLTIHETWRRWHRGAIAAVAVAASALYACTDEFHQNFVPGRSAQLSDILLDTLGALIGVLIIWGILHFHSLRRHLAKN